MSDSVMSTNLDRRTRKRLATRQAISDTATNLFGQRGFDNVTVDEIAAAADVGRMTVFNHFPRKEDMVFDLAEQGYADLREALRMRDVGVGPMEALRRFVRQAVAEERPYIGFHKCSPRFMDMVADSEALKARARAIRDELAAIVQAELAAAAERDREDPDARLAAQLILATWSVAFLEAHRSFRQSGDRGDGRKVFLRIVAKGEIGIQAALVGTSYG